MRRREALVLLTGSILSTGVLRAALAQPGHGNGHGNGNGGNGNGHGNGHGNSGKAKSVVNGVVSSVTGDAAGPQSFVVHAHGHGPAGYDVTVTVSASTTYRGEEGASATAADVKVGAQVQVRGAYDAAAKTLTATAILVKTPEGNEDGGGEHEAEVEGAVASVSTTGFVVHPKAHKGVQPPDVSVSTTGTTVFKKKDGSAATMADVVVGAEVEARGTVDAASGSLVADLVVVEPAED